MDETFVAMPNVIEVNLQKFPHKNSIWAWCMELGLILKHTTRIQIKLVYHMVDVVDHYLCFLHPSLKP
jgi:hypothetical protein